MFSRFCFLLFFSCWSLHGVLVALFLGVLFIACSACDVSLHVVLTYAIQVSQLGSWVFVECCSCVHGWPDFPAPLNSHMFSCMICFFDFLTWYPGLLLIVFPCPFIQFGVGLKEILHILWCFGFLAVLCFPWCFFPCCLWFSLVFWFLAVFARFPCCFGSQARIPCFFWVVSLS